MGISSTTAVFIPVIRWDCRSGLQIAQGQLISAPSPTRVCIWIDPAGAPHLTNVISQFQVTWTNGATTPFGLNEERASDAAVLYTAAVGESTRASGGLELVLERQGDSPWMPLQIGQSYNARVREVRNGGNSPLSPDRPVLSIGPALAPHLPTLSTGAGLRLSTGTIPDLTGSKTAMGGGPTLVREGKAVQVTDTQGRHPRTAVGWNKDFIFLVEVDGRQKNLSVGMTMPELAAYMVKLGCEQAMNLDGGGSATLWVFGNVMNSPSEGRERPAVNALVLVQKNKPQK
jgi:hypothetical protein